MRQNRLDWLGIVLGSVLLAGCAGQIGCGPALPTEAKADDDDTPIRGTSRPGAEDGSGTVQVLVDEDADGDVVVTAPSDLLEATLHFEYDKADVDMKGQGVVADHARLLLQNRNQVVEVVGHCDERGSREYNLALGERRAFAVAELLLAHGVRPSQIETRSYGEERPVDPASNEAAWAKNRRVEIHYQ